MRHRRIRIQFSGLPEGALCFSCPKGVQLRNSLIEALEAPYIMVARGKGLSESAVLVRHGLKNAFVAFVPALVSGIGLIFGAAGSVFCCQDPNCSVMVFINSARAGSFPIMIKVALLGIT